MFFRRSPRSIAPPLVPEPAPPPPPSFTAADLDGHPELVSQMILAAARNLSQRGDHRIIEPVDTARPGRPDRPLRIGLFGNLANQAFITARALRRLGHHVDVVVQENEIDAYPLSRPHWEEVHREVTVPGEGGERPSDWPVPDYVRLIRYEPDLHRRYQWRLSAVTEVIEIYRSLTGRVLARDEALLLAQWMGHWNYIAAMNDYDVVQLSMWPVLLGAFCPKPYVVCPLGGELYISAFQEDVGGLLFRTGFRGAAYISVPETDYPAYLDRLETRVPRTFMPLLVDTDVYVAGTDEALRAAWQTQVGGTRFLLSVCRQSWDWKGSDRVIRAFARFHAKGGSEWRLLLQSWGDDLEQSRALVTSLGLDAVTAWLPMCSKPLLRRRQRAADVVADQFVMEGYGASVLESMAAGKPVVMAPVPAEAAHHFRAGPPPLIGARSEIDILVALETLADDAARAEAGRRSRIWIEEEHGYRTLAPRMVAMFEQAAGWPSANEADGTRQGASPTVDYTLEALRSLHARRRDEIRVAWNRTVPFADQITDRWEKARYLGFGEGTSIYDSSTVFGDVRVGRDSWIGPNCVLEGSHGLEIGSTCSISAGCQLYSHDTVAWAVSGGVAPARYARTVVGDAVYLGPGAIVAAGSTIGDHVIVGALSLVRGEIPPYSFAAGAPARVIGRVSIDPDGTVSIHQDEPVEAASAPTSKLSDA